MAASSRSRRDALRLSDEQTIRFLNYYEGEPILWNPFLEQYRNRDARAEAAARIAKSMNIESFGPEQVIIKFKNLRSSYCQELKKIAASESSGASRDEVYVPQVKWFSKMDSFLKPHVTSRTSLSTYVVPAVELDDSEIDNSTSWDGNNWDVSSQVNGIDNIPEPDFRLVKKELELRPVHQNHHKKLKLGDTAANHSSSSDSRNHQDVLGQKDNGMEDTLDQFGRYLTSLLRTLPRQKAFVLQQQIINLAIAANIDND